LSVIFFLGGAAVAVFLVGEAAFFSESETSQSSFCRQLLLRPAAHVVVGILVGPLLRDGLGGHGGRHGGRGRLVNVCC